MAYRRSVCFVKRFAVVLAFIALLSTAVITAGAEGGNGKTEVTEIPSLFSKALTVYSGNFGEYVNIGYGMSLNNERAANGRITLLEGDGKYDGAVSFEPGAQNDIFFTCIPTFSRSGTALYHIYLESEHYYAGFDFQCDMVALEENDLGLAGKNASFPLNQEVTYDDLVNLGLLTDRLGVVKRFYICNYPDMLPSVDRQEYSLDHKEKTVCFRKAGQYRLLMQLDLNDYQTVFIPFVALAEEGNEQLSISGGPVSFRFGDYDTFFAGIDDSAAAVGSDDHMTDDGTAGPEDDADQEVSGEDLLAQAFSMEDEDGEETKENTEQNTAVLESMAQESGEHAEETQKMTEEDTAALLASMFREGTKGKEVPALIDEVFTGKETETVEKGVYKWAIPAGFTMYDSKSTELSKEGIYENEYDYSDGTKGHYITALIDSILNVPYRQDDESIRQTYQRLANSDRKSGVVFLEQEIMLDGQYPAYVTGRLVTGMNGNFQAVSRIQIIVRYMRGSNSLLKLIFRLDSEPGTEFAPDSMPALEQFMPLISQITYEVPENRAAADVPEALITEKDLVYHVEVQPDSPFIASGKTIRINAAYDKPELMNQFTGLQFYYTIFPTEQLLQGSQERADDSVAYVDWSGKLKAGTVTEPTDITVEITCATSPDVEYRRFIILPATVKVELAEKQLSLYADRQEPFVLQGTVTPENAWAWNDKGESNFVWSCDKEDVLALTDNKDRTVSIRPLKAGKASVTLTDTLTNKKAVLKVTVLEPVADVALEGPDSIASGKKASYKVKIEPKNAGNKKVQWRLDVDGSVAKVSGNGQVTVMKDVAFGTTFTLFCEAEGAAKPVIASKVITVE